MTGEQRGLVDTNVLILRPLLDPAELPVQMAISAVTLGELSAGPHATDDPAERASRIVLLQRAEAEFEPLPYDADAARVFGRVTAAVRAIGRSPRRRTPDLMIASVAIANGLPLHTVNPDDFHGLQNLVTIRAVTHPANRTHTEIHPGT